MTKKAIKELLLLGATIKFPYKRAEEDWISNAAIACGTYGISVDHEDLDKYRYEHHEIDEAINAFYNAVFTKKNLMFDGKRILHQYKL